MNKTELIAEVAAKTELSKKDAEKAVNAVFATIVDALKADEKVSLVGFGSFEAKTRPARMGHNPMPYYIKGDARLVMATIEDESIDCIVTTPPYWNLKKYNTESIQARTMDEYSDELLRVMAEAGTDAECERQVDAIIAAMDRSGHLIEVKK